ncbi:hypothetical protein [Novosphingobium sp. JCM 18896]|uniref:hypothetical protein n=1 Tax=Novosphingobium sp. JCM 18896 TaxID=2989731 RepID=UPI00222169B0|nr:hypothetical protein [Novosphingobium sp. JCM 18896]MCW1430093.1 hypothetical protein [Novosphingobium sp. JCM 18896]
MQSQATKRTGVTSFGPALVTALAVGAAVTAVAQPLTYQPTPLAAAPAKVPAVQTDTLRLTMPKPTFAVAAVRHEIAAPKLAALPLDPDTAVTAPAAPSTAAPAPAPLAVAAPKVQAAPLGTTSRIAPVIRIAPPQVAVDRLAAAKGRDMATYSPTRHTVTEAGKPQAMSMLGDEDWASLTRGPAAAQTASSANDRSAALQPSRKGARTPVGATAIDPVTTDDRPSASDDADKRIDSVSLTVATKLNGVTAGRVSLLIRDDENISVRLTDLLAVIESSVDPELYTRLGTSQAAQGYVTLNALRAAGIAIRFDDRDRLVIGTK